MLALTKLKDISIHVVFEEIFLPYTNLIKLSKSTNLHGEFSTYPNYFDKINLLYCLIVVNHFHQKTSPMTIKAQLPMKSLF